VLAAEVTSVVAIVAPITTLLAGLGGIWLGARLNRNAQHAQWLRDRRLDTYSALAAEASRFIDILSDAQTHWNVHQNREAFNRMAMEAVDSRRQVQLLVDRIFLVGSDKAINAASALNEVLVDDVMGFMVPNDDAAAVGSMTDRAADAVQEYIDAVRPEITDANPPKRPPKKRPG
jgi:hypothetical protein